MKKQIVAAAVAATMSAVALADISITGAAKVNYTNVDNAGSTPDTNKFTQETDLKIKGKNGDTEVVINFGGGSLDNTDATSDTRAGSGDNQMNVEDVYVKTNVSGVTIQAGTWDSGNNELRASSRADGKFKASTSIQGLDVSYSTTSNGASSEEVGVATSLGGVNLAYTKKIAGESVKASTTIGGVSAKYHVEGSDTANSDRTYVELSGKIGDVSVKVGQATADSGATIEGDTWMGDFEGATDAYDLSGGQDVQTIELSTSMAGNKVTFRNTQIDGVTNEDTDFNKIIVTRPLASGATFELTYTALDDYGTSNDTDTLDLELAVSF
jgi:hypothetical protein